MSSFPYFFYICILITMIKFNSSNVNVLKALAPSTIVFDEKIRRLKFCILNIVA